MAIVKFLSAKSPLKNIIGYVCNREKTEDKLIVGKDCMPESAEAEFMSVKHKYGKTDGRQYYHIIQSFAPDDDITPEQAQEIGMQFAEYFTGFQAIVVAHVNKAHLHNHIVLNSVSFETGKKFHQTADEMRIAKEYSDSICKQYGLSITEQKARRNVNPRWKDELKKTINFALSRSSCKETFIDFMQANGYGVSWEDGHKYVTFTTPDGVKCRDNKLFDERYLRYNMELYFELGGCNSFEQHEYMSYTPSEESYQPQNYQPAAGNLANLLAEIFAGYYENDVKPKYSHHSRKGIEKMIAHGLKPDEVFGSDEEFDEYHGMTM